MKISVPSSPLYKTQVWDYAEADKDEIRQFLTNIDWIGKFKDLSTNEMFAGNNLFQQFWE